MQGARCETMGQLYGESRLGEGEVWIVRPVDGGYVKMSDGSWMVRTPNGHMGSLGNHTVEEHEDGTITVTPSILVSWKVDGVEMELYHGFLERGVWRDC